MYHYVRPIKNSKYYKIKGLEIDGFKRQIEFFEKKFHFITIEELLDSAYSNKTIPKNSILLTFDDGFKDHFSHVFPILKKLMSSLLLKSMGLNTTGIFILTSVLLKKPISSRAFL